MVKCVLTRPSPALAKAVARRSAASVSPSAEIMLAFFTCSAFSTRNLDTKISKVDPTRGNVHPDHPAKKMQIRTQISAVQYMK